MRESHKLEAWILIRYPKKNSLITRHIFTPLDAINQIEKKIAKTTHIKEMGKSGSNKETRRGEKKLND